MINHKDIAKTCVKNFHRLYEHKQLASRPLITQLENIGWDELATGGSRTEGKGKGFHGRVTIFSYDRGVAELFFSRRRRRLGSHGKKEMQRRRRDGGEKII